jgi:hypothetical protein
MLAAPFCYIDLAIDMIMVILDVGHVNVQDDSDIQEERCEFTSMASCVRDTVCAR